MILLKHAFDLERYVDRERKNQKTIGFVPTMGALHAGHLSLLKICNRQTDISICSIFVNPTQFNDESDFKKYPVTIANDILKLEEEECNLLFYPDVQEVYPSGTKNQFTYDLGELDQLLEGEHRPGHFQGVCQVVHRLLAIVKPDKLFLGQKDYQQCLVIKKLVEQLSKPISVVIAETLREPSGLAMSSRNMRLNEEEKTIAAHIYKCLKYIKHHYKKDDFNALLNHSKNYLLNSGFTKVDYVAIANAKTLEPVNELNNKIPLVALIAAYVSEVRLIDNMMLNTESINS